MHATEAFLALADVTGDPLWLQRALRIVERLIHEHAAAFGHVVVEHFDAHWRPVPQYNADNRADPFRPYGSTPGHSFEWARLLLHLEAALAAAGLAVPNWLLSDAQGLFASACRHAWQVDGAPGLVYSLDWDRRAVVRARLHWVHAEASAAAAALLRRTDEAIYEHWYRQFWAFIAEHFIDLQGGAGTTSSTATTSRPPASGRESPISITPIRRCCCRAWRWHRVWPRRSQPM